MNIQLRGNAIKRYLKNLGGASPGYWENNWEKSPLDLDLLAAQADLRLVRKLRQYLQPGANILEGGCGSGAYLAYFQQRGYKMVGIDFAERTVARLNDAFPDIDVRVGDIKAINCDSNVFDAYYSGGVIEHFEEGLEQQIREAYRVLKPGGVFLVTVPYINAIRSLAARIFGDRITTDLDGQTTYLRVSVSQFRKEVPPVEGFVFHEYVLAPRVMRQALGDTGFNVETEMTFSAKWGLLDVAPYRRVAGIGHPRRHIGHKLAGAPLRIIDWVERRDNEVANVVAGIIGCVCGNLRLYVARKPRHA